MKEFDDLKNEIRVDSVRLIKKRWNRLKRRRFVLFPWLRRKWLMRKLYKINQYVGRGEN